MSVLGEYGNTAVASAFAALHVSAHVSSTQHAKASLASVIGTPIATTLKFELANTLICRFTDSCQETMAMWFEPPADLCTAVRAPWMQP